MADAPPPVPTRWGPPESKPTSPTPPRVTGPMLPPIGRQTAYIAPTPSDFQSPTTWGMPDPYTQRSNQYPGVDPSQNMPQPWQIPGIIQRAGGFFGMNGSAMMGMHSNNMMHFYAAFLKAYNERDDQLARRRKDDYLFHQQQAIDYQAKEQEAVREIFAIYPDAKDYETKLKPALIKYAQSQHDEPLEAAAKTNSLAVYRVLATREAELRNLSRANAQETKEEAAQRQLEQNRRDWGAPGAQPTQGQPQITPMPGAALNALGAPTTALPDIGGPAAATAAGAPTTAAAGTAAPAAGAAAGRTAFDQAVSQGVSGEDVTKLVPEDLADQARLAVAQKNAQIDRIAADPGLKPEEKLNQISAIDPNYGGILRAGHNYNVGATPRSGQALSRDMQLLAQIDPTGWSQRNYEFITRYQTPGGREERTLFRAAPTNAALLKVIDAINRLPTDLKDSFRIRRVVDQIIRTGTTDDATYTYLAQTVNAYTTQVTALVAQGGGTLTAQEERAKLLGTSLAPKQLRQNIIVDATEQRDTLAQLFDEWDRVLPHVRNPLWTPEVERAFANSSAIANMEPASGAIRGYVPPDLIPLTPRGTAKNPNISEAEWKKIMDWLATRHRDDPAAVEVRKQLGIE